MTKFCNYSERPLLLSKNALTIQKEPTEWPNFVFNQNNPLLLHNSSIKFCIYSKRSPPTLTKAVTATMEHLKYPNFVFIKKAPHPTSKKAVANFCFYSPKESSLKNSTRGPFGFECLSFTFCYLDFISTPYDLCHLLWWVGGWVGGGGAYFCSDLPDFFIY